MAANRRTDFIDVKALLEQYLSKWYYFVISVTLCAIIGFLYAKSKNYEYGVRANILIQQDETDPMSGLGGIADIFGSSGNVDDEIFVISSHSLYRDVAKELGLNKMHFVSQNLLRSTLEFPTFPIDVVPDAGIADTLTTLIDFKISVNKKGLADIKVKAKRAVLFNEDDVKLPHTISTPYGKFTVVTTPDYPAGEDVDSRIFVKGYDAAAEDIAKIVTSEIATKKSNVIELGVNTSNPKFGKAILNDIIEKYNLRGVAEKNTQNEKTAKFLDRRIDLLASELSKAEGDLQNFKEAHGIVDVSAEAKYQTEKRGKIEEELMKAETQAEVLRLTKEFIADNTNNYAMIPMTVENDGLQKAITTYNGMLLERISLMQDAMPDNYALRTLEEKIDAFRKNIQASVDKASQQADVAVKELKQLNSSTMSTLMKVPDQERQYLDMRRQQSVKGQLYIFLLQQREQTAMMLANSVPKGLIVDEAYTLNEPLGLKKWMLFAIFLMIGVCIPPFYIFLRRIIRNKVETRDDVESNISVPVLGEISLSKAGRAMIVGPGSNSSTAELFRLMRANLLFVMNEADEKVVLITSTQSGEGKTFIAINIAASLAMLDKKVLLIGMDIRLPRLAEYLDLKTNLGLTQYLSSDKITLDQITSRNVGVEGLDVIAAGPIPPNPSELLASKRVDAMFEALRKEYDYIVVDAAPVGIVSDTFSLKRISDATIYVTRINATKLTDIHFIDDIYEQNRLNKLSVVINGTPSKKVYGYGTSGNSK